MNPLTQIKNTQKVTRAEIDLGLSEKASWHDRFKHSAYVFVGGLPFELTEGDLLAVFAQCGEVADVHLVRDKKTGGWGGGGRRGRRHETQQSQQHASAARPSVPKSFTAVHQPLLVAGNSRGFAFLAYEDQRSTVLATDNLR